MKNLNASHLILLLAAGLTFFAFRSSDRVTAEMEYMTVTTVESIIPGGLGRSRMLISFPNGKTEQSKIENLYSIGGITMKNISFNDIAVNDKLAEFSADGWEVMDISTGVQSPSQGVNQGIYLTRYHLRRAK